VGSGRRFETAPQVGHVSKFGSVNPFYSHPMHWLAGFGIASARTPASSLGAHIALDQPQTGLTPASAL